MTPHPSHHLSGPAVGKLVTLYNSTTYFSLVFPFSFYTNNAIMKCAIWLFHSRMTDSFSMSLCNCSIINTLSIFNQYQMHSRFQIVLIRTWFAFYYMTLIRKYSTRNYGSRYHERHPLCLYHYHDDWLLWLIYLMNFSFVHIHDIHWLMVLFIWKFLLRAVAVFSLVTCNTEVGDLCFKSREVNTDNLIRKAHFKEFWSLIY